MIEIVRDRSSQVKRWESGEMAPRWTAAGMLAAEIQFRHVPGYREFPALATALKREPGIAQPSAATNWSLSCARRRAFFSEVIDVFVHATAHERQHGPERNRRVWLHRPLAHVAASPAFRALAGLTGVPRRGDRRPTPIRRPTTPWARRVLDLQIAPRRDSLSLCASDIKAAAALTPRGCFARSSC